ncbi:hypothetical protein RJ495_003432 [Pluralibacter gergoviae]|uniref:hypothetical protein n=1 Tax=Pluralibacter gergoviae TaxID=61647 RepID=UPI000AFCD3E3|nr:hypothetical protein [Pluralibacter gergoviae]ELD4302392.1 hypothetical protein [Pluralibacter gergoviae]ELG9931503.1 hypothetical protein [Pluralibacter gergoviae]ELK5594872.1 hypothetical protein [Pluralibacter gergoviae]ELN2736077.1 hypothetical protein [Pluralibacter gergoviae]ELN2739622.1 hypothetical protein [Pluralibacter gergoviae]
MKVILDGDFYTYSAIENMANQFSEYITVEVSHAEGIVLQMNVHDAYKLQRNVIINTFLNNVLELSIQEHLEDER